MNEFVNEAREAARIWKQTADLPAGARATGVYMRHPGKAYPFVLPREYASCNLLDGARDWALEFFGAAHIPWHDGVNGGPSNHLLSSQVQCVNALAPFAHDPDGLHALFGDALGVEKVLPFGDPVDPSSYVTFEWI